MEIHHKITSKSVVCFNVPFCNMMTVMEKKLVLKARLSRIIFLYLGFKNGLLLHR